MEYMIFYTGLASTPNSVGLKCLTNDEVVHEINIDRESGKETRKQYQKILSKLREKYSNII